MNLSEQKLVSMFIDKVIVYPDKVLIKFNFAPQKCGLTQKMSKKNLGVDNSTPRNGGEGVEFYLGVKYNRFGTWQGEYDKNNPIEIIEDIHKAQEYEFNYIAINKYLPWVSNI